MGMGMADMGDGCYRKRLLWDVAVMGMGELGMAVMRHG